MAKAAQVKLTVTEKPAKKVTGATVTVICKIPQGLMLQLYVKQEFTEVTMGGHRNGERYVERGEPILVRGPAHAQNEAPRTRNAGGYAITEGISKDHWDAWMEQTGQHLDAVKKGLLLAFDDSASAIDAAKDGKKIKTGLERLDPSNLPVTDARFQLKTADEQIAQIQHPEE